MGTAGIVVRALDLDALAGVAAAEEGWTTPERDTGETSVVAFNDSFSCCLGVCGRTSGSSAAPEDVDVSTGAGTVAEIESEGTIASGEDFSSLS